MSTTRQFHSFNDDFTSALEAQTGLTIGEFTALVMAGQNPSYPSEVMLFAQKIIKRREKGKRIKERDIDALIEMVVGYMAYQELSGRDRVTFSRQVLQKLLPNLTATDMQDTGPKEVHSLPAPDELKEVINEVIAELDDDS